MHTIRFPIVTGKEKEKILAKGFRAMARFHNIIVGEARRRLWNLQQDPEYIRLKTAYGQAVIILKYPPYMLPHRKSIQNTPL